MRGITNRPLLLEWGIPRRTAMVWGAANHTRSYPSIPVAGVEGRIFRKNSLGGYPSSGLRGIESDLSAAWGCTYRQCCWYVSLGESIHSIYGNNATKIHWSEIGMSKPIALVPPWVPCLRWWRCSVHARTPEISSKNHTPLAWISSWEPKLHSIS